MRAAYAGLGQAELALENYQEAREPFRRPSMRIHRTKSSKMHLDLIDASWRSIPNARGLRAAARYDRSKELLQARADARSTIASRETPTGRSAKGAGIGRAGRELEDAADMNLAARRGFVETGSETLRTGAPNPEDAVGEYSPVYQCDRRF